MAQLELGPWSVEWTNECSGWIQTLTDRQQEALLAVIRQLTHDGPGMKRPHSGEIVGSRSGAKMRELICSQDGALRVLYRFDHRGVGILLYGGDKAERQLWKKWYKTAIKEADRLYDRHVEQCKRQESLVGAQGARPQPERSGRSQHR